MDRDEGGLSKTLAELPAKLVRAVPWAQAEPAGFGVGTAQAEDMEEREARERSERETWRSVDEEPGGPASDR